MRRWGSGDYGRLRASSRAAQLAEIVPVLLRHFARSANPDGAVIAFDRFLAGLHGGGRLFSLLRQNPDLIALIALVLGTAPRLADRLAHFPEVMDAVIDPSFFGALPEEAELAAALDRSLAQARILRGLSRPHPHLCAGADVPDRHAHPVGHGIGASRRAKPSPGSPTCWSASLHRAVEENFARLHGRVAGQENGDPGARQARRAGDDGDLRPRPDRRLRFRSPSIRNPSGARPLYGAQYFSRLTQRLISALTAQTNYGVLYQVDMRLRPSGRSGPLATQIDGFASYQENEAWTWEHMALTRARVVSASPAFAARVEAVIRAVLCRPRDAEMVAGDVVEMRKAIATEKGDSDRWDLKYVAGGLIDIEFIAQYLQLVHAAQSPEILDTSTARVLDKAWRLGLLATEDAEVLRPAVRLYHDLTQILRLCLPGPFDPKAAAPGLVGLLARAADVPDFATLEAFLVETEAKVRASFMRILGASP